MEALVNKFNQQALKHQQGQALNPFSGQFQGGAGTDPHHLSKEQYGRPVAGSLTEARGMRAHSQIEREILELCEVLSEYGTPNPKDSSLQVITFGELFDIYTSISNKVVGILIAAKKRKYVYFEPEILFQRRDDDVIIYLLKPIQELRKLLKRQESPSQETVGERGEECRPEA